MSLGDFFSANNGSQLEKTVAVIFHFRVSIVDFHHFSVF